MSVFTNAAGATPSESAAYVDAILGLLGDRDPVTVLRTTPSALQSAIRPLPDEITVRREGEGKWSIRHVLRHLADSDLVWGWRMRMILAHDRPTITGYDQDAWATRLGYGEVDARESLAMFELLRRDNLRLIDNASPVDMSRVGIHVERGEESLEHLLRLYAGHDLLHLRQIERIRSAVS